MEGQRRVVIARLASDVFAFLGNPENWPLIEAGLLEYRHLTGRPGELGAVYLSRQERRGRVGERRMQITEYAPNRIIAVEGAWARGVKPGGGFAVEAVSDGAKVTTFVKVGARGVARLVVPLMAPLFARSLDAILANLQHVLMQQAGQACVAVTTHTKGVPRCPPSRTKPSRAVSRRRSTPATGIDAAAS